jgi:hypothetical protein
MNVVMKLAVLMCVPAAFCFAETWSGSLVDAKCYAAEQRNVNPTDTELFVDRDINYEIRYCSPSVKTKSFALVGEYGMDTPFDAAGNAKAADLVRNGGKKHVYSVAVSGQVTGNEIKVDSISVR